MSSFSSSELETEVREAGINLLALASCITTQVQELLHILDHLDELLSKVEQAPLRSMQDALYPSMKALISNQLLKHSDIYVKVSVASCMSELTRITAPDAPYDDVQMKEIFQLTVMALGMLSSKDTHGYSKALHILDNFVKVRACLLMLDLECDGLIADMFKHFLSTIRYIPLHVVFRQMEYIMTWTLEESEEISEVLLSALLTSVRKKKENVLSRSWRLGEKVLRNCAVKLQRFLPKVVRSKNLSFDDYSIVVASICQNSPEDEHVVAEEADPSAMDPSETIMDDGTSQKMTSGTLMGENSLRTLEHCHQIKQHGITEARRHSQPENSDVTGTVQVKAVKVRKKRGRKTSSLQKSKEGCRNSMTGVKRESFNEPRIGSSASLQSGLRQEERVTDSCIVPSRPLHMDTSKKECDDSEEFIEKDSRIPHGFNVFGEKLVGRRVKVWWPLDKIFYEGAVASFDSLTQTHKVLYADGDEETLNLRNERWDLLEEPSIEHSSPAAASHKYVKKEAKTKSASSRKQHGIISSSKWPRVADKSKTEAPKSGSDDFAPDATTDDVCKVDATFEDEKQKSSSETDDSKRDVLRIADVAKDSITVNPNIVDAKHKFSSEEETKTPTTIKKPKPHSVVERGGESAIHTTITENDK